jgi:cytochrome c biogenesis protein CcmG, thiol:disulfide interchange protein DsbE
VAGTAPAGGAPGADDVDARPVDADLLDAEPAGRDRHPARVAALGVGVVLAAFVALLVWRIGRGAAVEDGSSPLDGRTAPTLVGPTIDGGRYDLGADRGSWVVVNFFATWCPPCIQEHPELVEFERRHAAGGDRRVVSVVFGGAGETESVRRFFERNGGTWPVVVDPTGRMSVDYAVAKVPESILVSPTGLVLGKIKGGVTADELDRIIDGVEARAGIGP